MSNQFKQSLFYVSKQSRQELLIGRSGLDNREQPEVRLNSSQVGPSFWCVSVCSVLSKTWHQSFCVPWDIILWNERHTLSTFPTVFFAGVPGLVENHQVGPLSNCYVAVIPPQQTQLRTLRRAWRLSWPSFWAETTRTSSNNTTKQQKFEIWNFGFLEQNVHILEHMSLHRVAFKWPGPYA